jgi:phosphate transport system substrate-binding protein
MSTREVLRKTDTLMEQGAKTRRNCMKKKGLVLGSACLLLIVIFAAVMAAGCGGVTGNVTASGSTTVQPIAQAAAEQFMKQNSGANVTVQGGGSSVGVTQVTEGSVNIGNSSRELKPEEEGKGLVDHQIAYDVIVMIVNPSVTVKNLTSAQAKDIFIGKVTNWSQVGGANAPIVVGIRDSASGTREMFDQKILGLTATNPVKPVAGAQESNSNGIMVQKVGSTSNMIGYTSYGYIKSSVKPVQLDGVTGNLANALNNTYPLGRYLHMFTKGKATGATESYINFVLSDDFQTNTVSKEYIPISKAQAAIKK